MNAMKWIGLRPDAVCAAYLKDLPRTKWQTAVKIEFRFEVVYCLLEREHIVCKDGNLMKVAVVHRSGKQTLIGRADYLQTGIDWFEDGKQFQSALTERAIEESKYAESQLMES
jgi:hypothetical protein